MYLVTICLSFYFILLDIIDIITMGYQKNLVYNYSYIEFKLGYMFN